MHEIVRGYARDEKDAKRLIAKGLKERQIYRRDHNEELGHFKMRRGELLGVVDGFRVFGDSRSEIMKAVRLIQSWEAVAIDVESGERSDRNGAEMLDRGLSKRVAEERMPGGKRARDMQAASVKARVNGRMPEREALKFWRDATLTGPQALACMTKWSYRAAYDKLGKRNLPPGRRSLDFVAAGPDVPVPKIRQKPGKRGIIYFVRAGGVGPVKIGFSTKHISRIVGLQTSHHRKLVMVAAMQGTRRNEGELHGRFDKYHIQGEWFRYAGDVKAFAQSLPKLDLSE
jgi:hypothetical protein